MIKRSNPQGKGLVPVLENLFACRSLVPVEKKSLQRICAELFTSLFILNSRFQFKPVVGGQYWLYRKYGEFRLSLIAPGQWSGYGQYVGRCELHEDLSWSLELDVQAEQDSELMAYIARQQALFKQQLERVEALEQVLPVYEKNLPFNQRVLAYGLAHSLGQSMVLGGLRGLSYEQAQALITHQQTPDSC